MIRDATRPDADQMAAVFAAVVPNQVRTAAWFRHELDHPRSHGTSRQLVAENGGVIAAVAGLGVDADEPVRARCWLVVHPEHQGAGIGSALLDHVTGLARDAGAEQLSGIAADHPRSLAFAERHGFRRGRQHVISAVDPATVPDAGPPPPGMRLLACSDLPDEDSVRLLLNATAADDPSGLSVQMLPPEFARLWHGPDHRRELGAAMITDDRVVSFTSVLVDLDRGRAWTAMTATDPEQRGRGLARLVKTASLRALSAAGVGTASTGNDNENAPMLAVNRRLGYAPVVTTWSVQRSV